LKQSRFFIDCFVVKTPPRNDRAPNKNAPACIFTYKRGAPVLTWPAN